jgi:ADP-ribosylglycohydrolase
MGELIRSKVRGTFLGCAIGDSLGMAVETFSRERIAKEYGRVTQYFEPKGHKWFDGQPAGMITDDTVLTLAVAEAMMESPLDMDAQVNHHIAAMRLGTMGWGRSTKQSIRKLANGASWLNSGSDTGVGNGIAMKIAPLGLYCACGGPGHDPSLGEFDRIMVFAAELATMTHNTSIAVSSGFAMMIAVFEAFTASPYFSSEHMTKERFIELIVAISKTGEKVLPETLNEDRLTERLRLLHKYEEYDTDRMVDEFGGGSCYCYNSVPFTLMHFVRDQSINSLYDVVSAGGDTDSNGSMVGALLGAMHGESVFPVELVDGLIEKDRVLDVADRFYEKFYHSWAEK